MKKLIAYLVIAVAIITACTNFPDIQIAENVTHKAAILSQKKDEDKFSFFVLSDWGRNGIKSQKKIANCMALEADSQKPEFIVSCGDNFQEGVESVDDFQWETSFEDIYDSPSLQLDWYAALGNRDYKGDVQAQLNYGTVNSRWKLQSHYYTFVKQISDSVSARFIILDTTPLLGKYYSKDGYYNVETQDSARQIAWLKSVLADAKEQWKIVVGHHPLHSSEDEAGGSPELMKSLLPVLKKNKVQFYISGHDSEQQHFRELGGQIDFMISGSGIEKQPLGINPMSLFRKQIPAFAEVAFHGDSISYSIINSKGICEYKYQRSYR